MIFIYLTPKHTNRCNLTCHELLLAYLAAIAPSIWGLCVEREYRKFVLKYLFWFEKLASASTCWDQLTFGHISPGTGLAPPVECFLLIPATVSYKVKTNNTPGQRR